MYGDAFEVGLGCVLMQYDDSLIAYASRQLWPYERNYITHDLEVTGVGVI